MNNIQKTVTGVVAAVTILTSAGVSAKVNNRWQFNKNQFNKVFVKFPNINDCFENGTTQKPETEKPEAEIPGTETPETNNGETNASQYELKVLELVNNERIKNGLGKLELKEDLSTVARNHSMDMAKNNYFSHTNLKGQTPFDRLKSAGISYSYAGENIASGQTTPEAVVNAWMNSEGHRKNILNSNFTKIGIGYYNRYWTQVFTS